MKAIDANNNMENLIAFIGLSIGLLLMQVNKSIPVYDYSAFYPFLATLAGAYGKMYKEWGIKTKQRLFFEASVSTAAGLIIGGTAVEYFNPSGDWTPLSLFLAGGYLALLILDIILIIGNKLKDSSWNIFKNLTKLNDENK
jgi:hypothetical protein